MKTLTSKAISFAKKHQGITRKEFEKIGFAPNSCSRTIEAHFKKAKGLRNGLTKYVVR